MNTKNIRSFRKILRKFERLNQILNNECCQAVTLAQCHTLLEIEEKGSTTGLELAKSLRLDKSTLSRTIKSLVNKEFINREQHQGDRRHILLSLTEKGKQICKQLNQENDQYYMQIFKNIPVSEQMKVLHYFEILINATITYERERKKENICCP
jgi:DNA-binding MarR family transcriptional regulator